jgi:hypothetical protein
LNNPLIDISTGKPIKDSSRAKRGQDAKRWKFFMGMVERGEAVISMDGIPVTGNLLIGTVEYIDEQIKNSFKLKRSQDAVKRRAKSKE